MKAQQGADAEKAARAAAREEIKRIIAELEAAGVTLWKIKLMCGRHFETVKGWKQSGRVEHYDGERLRAIHAHYCGTTES